METYRNEDQASRAGVHAGLRGRLAAVLRQQSFGCSTSRDIIFKPKWWLQPERWLRMRVVRITDSDWFLALEKTRLPFPGLFLAVLCSSSSTAASCNLHPN